MTRHFLLLLGALLLCLPTLTIGQNYGEPPYDFQNYGPSDGAINDLGGNSFEVYSCFSNTDLNIEFNSSHEFQVSHNGNIVQPLSTGTSAYVSNANSGDFVSIQITGGPELYFNFLSTSSIIDVDSMSLTFWRDTENSSSSQDQGGSYFTADTVVLCDRNPTGLKALYLNFYNSGSAVLQNVEVAAFYERSEFVTYRNGSSTQRTYIDPYGVYNIQDVFGYVMDDDIVKAALHLNNYNVFASPYSGAFCLSSSLGLISSDEHFVSKQVNPTIDFLPTDTLICPGDTIILEIPESEIFEEYWRFDYPGYGTFIENENNIGKVVRPGKSYAYYLPNDNLNQCYTMTDTVNFIVDQDCPQGLVAVTAYHDRNGDQNLNSWEPELKDQFMEILETGDIIQTDEEGLGWALLPINQTYHLVHKGNNTWVATDTIEVTFADTIDWNAFVDYEFALYPETNNDLQVYLSVGRLRPGFEANLTINVVNTSATNLSTDPILILDPALEYVGWVSGRTVQSAGDTVEFSWPNTFSSGTNWTSTIQVRVPADVNLLGEDLLNVAIFDLSDEDETNNVDSVYTTVTGSYDPNDKSLFDGIGETATVFVTDSTDFIYTIRFQNTGTDTAFTVVIDDQVSEFLDPYSIQMISSSHDYSYAINGDVITWTFQNILLPDSIVDEPGSHGYIVFSLEQVPGNADGVEISNTAEIYFDFNPAIVTNTISAVIGEPFGSVITSSNEYSSKSDLIELFPNPVLNSLQLTSQDAKIRSIKISDLTGKIVFKSENQTTSVDTSGLPEGSYIITIELETSIHTEHFVKQK